MASGYGLNGRQGRCFPFWQELLACYVVSTSSDVTGARKCLPQLEDYEECLHHRKERHRVALMQHAYRRHEAADPREQPRLDQVRNLGLLGKEKDTEDVLGIARATGEK